MEHRDTQHDDAHDDDARSYDEFRRSMRRRFRLLAGGLLAGTLVLNVAPVAANHLNVKTSDINNGAVTTPKIANGAVTTAKLAGGAVGTAKMKDNAVTTPKVNNGAITTPKLRNRAVTGQKIALGAPGIAPAGVSTAGTTVRTWFNRFGGQPTVTNPSTGAWFVTFPGLEGRLGFDAIVSATIAAGDCHVRQFGSFNLDTVELRTYSIATGNLTSSCDLNVVVMAPNDAGAGSVASGAGDDTSVLTAEERVAPED